ncbi:MAG: magnesium/cobalt transporter CorA [Gammaproteobacteria bacterium]
MREIIKTRSRKAGMPPGSLVHIGEQRSQTTELRLMHYDAQHLEQTLLPTLADCGEYVSRPGVTWLHISGVHQADVLRSLDRFGLHPLVIEDIMNTDQRTKFEDYGDYLYLVVKSLSSPNDGIETEQVSIVFGRNFVISVEESPSGAFESVRQMVVHDRGQVRQSGADYLAYLLLDKVVDNYFVVLERFGERVERLQDELIQDVRPEQLQRLHALRRESLLLRRSIWPLRDVLAGIERERSPLVRDTTRVYLRDVYDHAIHVVDTIETARETLAGMLDVYVSSTTNRLNEVIKVLTIISTVFIPPMFIASVYGMNFRNMPELAWPWGYATAWVLMIALALAMVVYFKRKRWF